ncbi:MAG: hypothetical protein ABIO24_13575 [Saprospiraceae bacterium]
MRDQKIQQGRIDEAAKSKTTFRKRRQKNGFSGNCGIKKSALHYAEQTHQNKTKNQLLFKSSSASLRPGLFFAASP